MITDLIAAYGGARSPLLNPDRVPVAIRDALDRYAKHGIPPGSFCSAVLANDLHDAIIRADPQSLATLQAIACYVAVKLPYASWGSREAVEAWIAGHRSVAP